MGPDKIDDTKVFDYKDYILYPSSRWEVGKKRN